MAYSIPSAELIDHKPSAIRDFHVYGFEWIDNLHFILSPNGFIADPTAYINVAKARFALAGWEGDGEVGLLWLPPFAFPLAMKIPPKGLILWHVKQTEDGVSFLLSPLPLPFEEFGGGQAE